MELKAVKREGAAPAGMLAGIAYNKDKNISLSVDTKAFDRVFRQQSTHGLIDLVIDNETIPALVKTVQMDKRRRVPIHVDFYVVTYGQEIEAPVPIHTTGKSKGVVAGGIVEIHVHNLHIIAPGPRRIPQEFVIDITDLDVGEVFTAGELKLPEGVKLAVPTDVALVSIVPPKGAVAES